MKIVTVVGARPQFVKAAAVSLAIGERDDRIDEVLVHTGQHYDPLMSDVFFDELDVRTPAHLLGVGSARHGQQTADVMARLEPIVCLEQPDAVVVYGDTNSTLGAALVAAKLHIPVVHVEAGLRSYDKRMPEEVNRVLTDHVSDLLLCPSRQAIVNLSAEGISNGVAFTGDVMHGVLMRTLAGLDGRNPVMERLQFGDEPYVVVTMHRAANTDNRERSAAVMEALIELAAGGLHVVFPVHPRTRAVLGPRTPQSRLHLLDPLGYREMVALTAAAHGVVTDSGGLQKEAAWLGVACLTMRDETEWVETVDAGWNRIVGTSRRAIVDGVRSMETPDEPFEQYGGIDAADRVVAELIDRYGS